MRTLLTDLRGNPVSIASRRSTRQSLHRKSLLILLVENQAWNDVVRRARSHVSELQKVDEQGNTPLHLACKFDPPVCVIRALHTATTTAAAPGIHPTNSAAASKYNRIGLTPLHVAASHRCNAKTLQALIDLYPAALRTPSRRERTPMHYACLSFRGLDVEAFAILLEATLKAEEEEEEEDIGENIDDDDDDDETKDTSGVLTWKDSTGNTPLGLLFRRYRERVRAAICRLNQPKNQQQAVLSDLGHLWGKARLIVARLTEERLQREGAMMLNQEEDDSSLAWAVEQDPVGDEKFRIVHASVGLTGYGCPPELVRLAIAMHPQQMREMDEDGNLVSAT
jgi:hypothetical protein